ARALLPAFLVAPMRGDAVFRMLVHLGRSDLHLERLALRPDHRRVERAIAVCLRLRDVIVELAGERRPEVMHHAECCITVADVVDQDAHRADIVERVDSDFLATHVVPDAVDVLRPSGDLRPNSRSRELFAKKTDDIVDITLAVALPTRLPPR